MPLPIAHSAAGIATYVAFAPNFHSPSRIKSGRLQLGLILATLSILPDFDFLPGMLIGQPNRFHHGASHSLLGVLLISGITWLLCRNFFKGLSRTKLWLLLFLATFSHLALDFFSSDTSLPFGIPVFWPFSYEYFISPFPLFRNIQRSGESNTIFLKTLLNSNNGWEVALEIVFSGILFALAILNKILIKSWAFYFVTFCLFTMVILFYALLTEPNWFRISHCQILNSDINQNLTLGHLSKIGPPLQRYFLQNSLSYL